MHGKAIAWVEKEEIKPLVSHILAKIPSGMSHKELVRLSWRAYAKEIKPALEAEDRSRAESMAHSFTKVVRSQ